MLLTMTHYNDVTVSVKSLCKTVFCQRINSDDKGFFQITVKIVENFNFPKIIFGH